MIRSKKDYIEYLKADAAAHNCKYHRFSFGPFERNDLYRFQRLLRKTEYYNNCKGKLFKPYTFFLKWRYKRAKIRYGLSIPLNVFGKGLSIAHYGLIVVNGNARIGDNCRIHCGVNIGTAAGYGDKAPIIGNNVYIAPGAKIYGLIKIGDNTVIGANAVVNKSFEMGGVTIAGVPAKVISNKGKDKLGK